MHNVLHFHSSISVIAFKSGKWEKDEEKIRKGSQIHGRLYTSQSDDGNRDIQGDLFKIAYFRK